MNSVSSAVNEQSGEKVIKWAYNIDIGQNGSGQPNVAKVPKAVGRGQLARKLLVF